MDKQPDRGRHTDRGRHSKISKKWLRMAEIYKRFIPAISTDRTIDTDESAMYEMYNYETFGIPITNRNNGYFIGKKWMDITIKMWKEDIDNELLFVFELQNDGYPYWFLKKIGVLK